MRIALKKKKNRKQPQNKKKSVVIKQEPGGLSTIEVQEQGEAYQFYNRLSAPGWGRCLEEGLGRALRWGERSLRMAREEGPQRKARPG